MAFATGKPLGFLQVTGINATAKFADNTTNLSGTIPPGTNWILIQAEGQGIRWRDGGTDPTATVGQLIAAGDSIGYQVAITKIKFLAATAGGTVNISFYAV
jgi:hypothetical protein